MPDKKLEHDRLVRGIAKGALIVLIGSVLGRIFGYLVKILIFTKFNVSVYGYINTSLSIFTIITTIALLGIPNSLPRQISYYLSKNKPKHLQGNITGAFFISSIIGALFAFFTISSNRWIAIDIFREPNLRLYLIYFGLSIPFFLWLRISSSVLQGFKMMAEFVLFRHLLRQLLICIILIFFIIIGLSHKHLGTIFLLSFTVSSVFSIIIVLKRTSYKIFPIDFDISHTKSLFDFSWPLMLSSVIMLLMHRTDTLMIGYFLNQTKVGIYNIAVPIGELLEVVYQSFIPLLIPLLTGYFASNKTVLFKNSYHLSTKWILILTIPLYLVIMLFPDFITELLFKASYTESSLALQVLASGILFTALVGPTGNTLIVIGKPRILLIDSVMAYILNIFLNVILIPKYGIIGSAFSTATSIAIHNILTLIQIKYYMGFSPFNRVNIKIFLAGIISYAGVQLVFNPETTINYIAGSVSVVTLFLIICYIFKVFNQDDKLLLIEAKKKLFK